MATVQRDQASSGAYTAPNSSPSVLDRFLGLISKIFSIFSCFQNNTDTAQGHQSKPLSTGRATTNPPSSSKRVRVAVGQTRANGANVPRETAKIVSPKVTSPDVAKLNGTIVPEKKAEIVGPEVTSLDVAKLKRDAQATSAEIEGKLGVLQQATPTRSTINNGEAYLAKLEDFDRELVQAGEPKVFDKQIVQLKSILEAKRIELAQPRNRLDQAGPPPRRRRVQFASTTPTVTETPAPAPAPAAVAPSSHTSPYAAMSTKKLQQIVRMRKKQPSAPKPLGEIAELQRRGITV